MSVDVVKVDAVLLPPAAVAADAVVISPVAAVDVTVPPPIPVVVEVVVGQVMGGGLAAMTATFGSVTPISPGTTAYIGIGWSIEEWKVAFGVLVEGEVNELATTLGLADFSAGSISIRLRKNYEDTTLGSTFSGGGGSIAGPPVHFDKGDVACIKAVVSADVPGPVVITVSWHLGPP